MMITNSDFVNIM